MKKIIALLVLLLLAGCAKITECGNCLEEKKCHQYMVTYNGMSEEYYLCDECKELLETRFGFDIK